MKAVTGFVFVVISNDDNLNNKVSSQDKTNWWKPAVELFSQVSSWIVVPVILALVLGKYLDGKYDTKPWLFLALTGLAFFISAFGIVRIVTKYTKKITDENLPSDKAMEDTIKK